MGNKKVKSALGEIVDFDLLKIKKNIENRVKPDSVEMREKYIDIRRRRNPRRNVSDLLREQNKNKMDAQERIQQSKTNKQNAEVAVNESVDGMHMHVTEPVEETPTPTKASSKKKIVKKKVLEKTEK